MKKVHNKKLFFFGIFVFFSILLFFIFYSMCRASQYRFAFDPLVTEQLQNDIIKASDLFAQRLGVSLDVCDYLSAQYPFLFSIQAIHKTPGIMDVIIEASAPLISINNGYIVTQHGALMPGSCYVPVDLGSVVIKTFDPVAPRLPKAFNALIHNIDYELFKMYDFLWIDETMLLIKDRADQNLVIVSNAQTGINKRFHELCKQVLYDKKQQENHKNKLIVDIRFNNQLIVKVAGEKNEWDYIF